MEVRTLLAAACLLTLVGCSNAQLPESQADAIESESSAGRSGASLGQASTDLGETEEVSSTSTQLPVIGGSVGGDTKVSSWDEQLQQRTPSQRDRLERLNESFAGLLAWNDVDVRRRQQELGYPSEQQWIEAERATTEQLKAAADHAGVAERTVYLDRLVEEAEALSATGPINNEADMAKGIRLAGEFGQGAGPLRYSHTPLTIMLEARQHAASSRRPEYVAAGLMTARDMGAPGAEQRLNEFLAAHPNLEMPLVERLHAQLQRTARVE